jgi:hypothetical protein
MDYFFWDEIFGERKRLPDEAPSPHLAPSSEPLDASDVVAVIIAWAPFGRGRPPSNKGLEGRSLRDP